MTVLAAHTWRTNAELMVDVSKLGYLGDDGSMVLDVTYGRGNFWTKCRPAWLVSCDLRNLPKVDYTGVDFRTLPFADETADVIVMDPPYRLNGTPDQDDFDDRYGIQEAMPWQQRMAMIHDGIKDCARVLKVNGHFLLKCQSQVCSGAVRWQDIYFAQQANACGMTLVDRFSMMPTKTRVQPGDRRQVHAHGQPSMLLVFKKRKAKK